MRARSVEIALLLSGVAALLLVTPLRLLWLRGDALLPFAGWAVLIALAYAAAKERR